MKMIMIEITNSGEIIELSANALNEIKNNKYEIKGSPKDRANALAYIDSQREPLWEHLFKYFLTKESYSHSAWAKTILNICNRLNNLKLEGKGVITNEEFYNYLFDDFSNLAEENVKEAKEDLGKLKDAVILHDLDDSLVWHTIGKMIKNISNELYKRRKSKQRFTMDEISTMLKENKAIIENTKVLTGKRGGKYHLIDQNQPDKPSNREYISRN